MNCPTCHAPMTVKQGKYGKFWACSRWPKCQQKTIKYTENKTVSDDDLFALPPKIERALFDINCQAEHVNGNRCLSCEGKYFPSRYQEDIYRWVDNLFKRGFSKLHALLIEAVAGSGKTTLLAELVRYIPETYKIAVLSFAVKNAKDFGEKIDPHRAHLSTSHSLSRSNVFRAYHQPKIGKRVSLETDKLSNIWGKILEDYSKEDRKPLYPLRGDILKIVEFIKGSMQTPTHEVIYALMDFHNIDFEEMESSAIQLIKKVWEVSEAQRKDPYNRIVDFTDTMLLCIEDPSICETFDVVMVDELQDTDFLQQHFYKCCCKEHGLFIGVGDRFQAIYGWRGAHTTAMDAIAALFDAERLPLSLSYRCSRIVAKMVNKRYPEIPFETWDGAKPGSYRTYKAWEWQENVQEGDMILCRINAPLVRPCLDLLARGIKAVIAGRDIGANLVALVAKIQGGIEDDKENLDKFLYALAEYRRTKSEILTRKNKISELIALEDKIEGIIAFSDECQTVSEINDKIRSVFSDDKRTPVTFSSVHKAKGLEAKRVFILRPDLIPHPRADSSWQLEQERNCGYVAITRTMDFIAEILPE